MASFGSFEDASGAQSLASSAFLEAVDGEDVALCSCARAVKAGAPDPSFALTFSCFLTLKGLSPQRIVVIVVIVVEGKKTTRVGQHRVAMLLVNFVLNSSLGNYIESPSYCPVTKIQRKSKDPRASPNKSYFVPLDLQNLVLSSVILEE